MDKDLHQIAKAPMIALIEKKNIVENNLKTRVIGAKTLLLLLLLGLMMPLTAQAQQETLTLYDGPRFCFNVPLNIAVLSWYTKSQFVIPADNLMEMANGTISGMKFYAKPGSSYTSDCPVNVYLMEVDYTAINTYEPQSNATIVYHGTIEIVATTSSSELTISFDPPYPYAGGNLLVGMDNMEISSYGGGGLYFLGTDVTGASIAGSGSSMTNISAYQYDFIPKTTFTYTPSACELPETMEAEGITPHQATLTWTGGSGTYNVEIKTGDGEWTRVLTNTTATNHTLETLADDMDYQARVQSVCGNETSGWRSVTFSTPIACFAPTGLAVTLNPDDPTEATLSWTENGEATAWQICLDDDEANLTEADSNPFTLTNLSLGTAYTVKVRAYCNDIDQSTWSNTVSFTPSFSFTVHDGTETNYHAPMTRHWSDEYSRSQFVVPAADLISMAGSTISSMTFYTTTENIPFTYNKPVDVYLMEVDYSAFDSNNPQFESKDNATIVYQGLFQIVSTENGGELTFYFSEPFYYNCGNLLVGIENTQIGWGLRTITFYGTTATSASVFGTDEYYYWLSAETDDFIPKTTFNYTPSACGLPETLEAENITSHQATLTWTGGSGTYNVEIKTGDGEWTRVYTNLAANTCTLENLMPLTEYQARVQSVCDNVTSNWRSVKVPMTITIDSPYTQGFESPEGTASSYNGALPECWETKGNVWVFPHNCTNWSQSGTQSLAFYGASNFTTYFYSFTMLPEFSNPLSGLQISFWMYIPSNNTGSIELGYITSEDNGFGNTFTSLATFNCNNGNVVQHSMVLDNVPAEAQRLVFKWETHIVTFFIDDVEVSINPLAYNFGGGSGTETDPYLIATTDHMDVLAANVNNGNNYSGKFFRMVADLDYTGKTYTRIGTSAGQHFSGNFDGNGHTISHVTLNENENYLGLFGFSNGMVKNLTLDHSSIHAEQGGSVGGIVGCCSWGAVTGCYVTENVSISATGVDSGMGMTMGGDNVGGIVGTAYYCTVSNCMNFADVSGVKFVGGVAGADNTSTITNNYYAGNCNVGGIGNHESSIGSDVEGQAQRGYAIEPQRPLGISLEGSIGLSYDGKVYAGENQEVLVNLEISNSTNTPLCYMISAGTLDDNGDGTFTITMPAEDITVSSNIVEQDGLYYELPCNGDNTATLIRDDSYPMLQGVYIDESITVTGTDYFVTAIADYAFDGCDSIQYVDCHAQLTAIGDYAFRNCTSLEYIGLYNGHTPPTVGTGCFDGLGLDTLWLMVPFCSQYDYAIHGVWGQFGTLFPDGNCEYNFIGSGGDRLWSNPDNWYDGEMPGAGAQVGIMSDCEMDTDVTIGSITIGSYIDEEWGYYERLTVKSGNTLTASNFIYTTGDERNFVIEDGAQVYHPNAGAKATVEKNITAYTPNTKNGWHLVSSPAIEGFAPSVDNGFLANEYDLYFYDEPAHYWRNYKPNGQYAGFYIEPLKGYLYANSANDTLSLTGTLRAATEMVNVPLNYTSTAGDLKGFNLVGNPFAHKVTSFAGANVAEEVYQLNDLRNEIVVGSISETNPLKPGEGFFVKAMAEDASITFNDNGGAKGGAMALESVERPTITLEISQNGLIVDRLILKRNGAPLEKFTLNENSTKIYATEDGQDWAVAVIASEAKQSSPTEQALNFKAAKNSTYTLNVNVENMDLDYLHLIDNMTGADVDMLASPTYTFTANTADYASRFRLVFSAAGASAGSASDAPFAYINNGNIVITTDVDDATLQVMDMTGRVIVSHDGHTRYIPTTGMPAGVYVLRLIDGDSVRTQKMVIN